MGGQVSGLNIGPVHKKDVMRASIMLEHQREYATMLCFDVKVERDAQELADDLGVRVYKADIIYHLFDAFTAYMKVRAVDPPERTRSPVTPWSPRPPHPASCAHHRVRARRGSRRSRSAARPTKRRKQCSRAFWRLFRAVSSTTGTRSSLVSRSWKACSASARRSAFRLATYVCDMGYGRGPGRRGEEKESACRSALG